MLAESGVPGMYFQISKNFLRRGRWASDVALIYQRDLIAEQLEAAADAGNASGMDLEGLCDDFVTRAR